MHTPVTDSYPTCIMNEYIVYIEQITYIHYNIAHTCMDDK
jgi:hypothetical protein